MPRAFSAFLLVFCFLSLIVDQNSLAGVFGVGSVVLFALDLLVSKQVAEDRVSKARVGTIL